MQDLRGKVAVVTGAGRGIGRAAALELARGGAAVACCARSAGDVQGVAGEIVAAGGRALALPADLSATNGAELVREVEARLGPVDILVNNAAAIGPFGALWEVDPAEFERALRVNLLAPFLLAHAVLPGMLRRGWGRIVNVSSGAARSPIDRTGPYSTSKAGLDMLTRQLAREVEGTGVAAIVVYPGIVDTAMQTAIREQPDTLVGQQVSQRFRGFHAEGQLQPPEAPARLIAVLCGAAGAELSGAIVDIRDENGQRLLRR